MNGDRYEIRLERSTSEFLSLSASYQRKKRRKKMNKTTENLNVSQLKLVQKCNSFFKTTPGDKFSNILADYMNLFDLEIKDLAGQFQVSISTVERWLEEKSSPYQKIQEQIVLEIKHEII